MAGTDPISVGRTNFNRIERPQPTKVPDAPVQAPKRTPKFLEDQAMIESKGRVNSADETLLNYVSNSPEGVDPGDWLAAADETPMKKAAAAPPDGPTKVKMPEGGWTKDDPMPTTPKGQAMVLSANLREGFVNDDGDVENTADMKNFGRRIAETLDYAPDVLTLSEVVGKSAENVAKILSRKTGHEYVVVRAPGASAFNGGVTTDTAILVNKDTMKVEKSGFAQTPRHKKNEDGEIEKEGVNQHAYAVLKEEGSDLRVNVVSVHLPTAEAYGMTRDEAFEERARAAEKLTGFIEENLKGDHPSIDVIAGDFNNVEKVGDKKTDMYKEMTGKGKNQQGYQDSVRDHGTDQDDGAEKDKRLDYIFVKGSVVDADTDHTYTKEMRQGGFKSIDKSGDQTKIEKKPEKGKEDQLGEYYSDHAFQWALVGTPTDE